MNNKEMIVSVLKKNRKGLTIEEISARTQLNRMTVSTYLRELKAEKKITVRQVGSTKLHFWGIKNV